MKFQLLPVSLTIFSTFANAYQTENCSNILSQGIYNSIVSSEEVSKSTALKDHICYNTSSSQSSSNDSNGSLSIGYGDLDLNLGGNGSADSYESFTRKYCRDTSYNTSYHSATYFATRYASPEIVDAWKTCMKNKLGASKPLLCYANGGDTAKSTVSITIDYHDYNGNLTASVPQKRNLEIDQNVSFERVLPGEKKIVVDITDRSKDSLFVLNATNGTKHYSCEVFLPGRNDPSKLTIEEYQNQRCEKERLNALDSGKISQHDYDFFKEMGFYPVFNDQGRFVGGDLCSLIDG